MIGFKVIVNQDEPVLVSNSNTGNISLSLNYLNRSSDESILSLYAGGIDNNARKHFSYDFAKLKNGDKITISICEVKERSMPNHEYEEEELIEELVNKNDLKQYNKLKEKLLKLGLI